MQAHTARINPKPITTTLNPKPPQNPKPQTKKTYVHPAAAEELLPALLRHPPGHGDGGKAPGLRHDLRRCF